MEDCGRSSDAKVSTANESGAFKNLNAVDKCSVSTVDEAIAIDDECSLSSAAETVGIVSDDASVKSNPLEDECVITSVKVKKAASKLAASQTKNDPETWFRMYKLPVLPAYLEEFLQADSSPSKLTSLARNKVIHVVFDSIAIHTL